MRLYILEVFIHTVKQRWRKGIAGVARAMGPPLLPTPMLVLLQNGAIPGAGRCGWVTHGGGAIRWGHSYITLPWAHSGLCASLP